MSDIPLPLTFRADIIQQVVEHASKCESCCVYGVASVGKDNLMRQLVRPDVRAEFFGKPEPFKGRYGPNGEKVVIVYINCKPYSQRALPLFFLHMLERLAETLQERPGEFESVLPQFEVFISEARDKPDIVANTNLVKATRLLNRSGVELIVFLLDDADDLMRDAVEVLFSDLRHLRQENKRNLAYVLVTRRQAAFLRKSPVYEELFELLSAVDHNIPLPPYNHQDGLLMLQRLRAREPYPDRYREQLLEELFEMAGGHAGLERTLFYAVRNGIAPDQLPDNVDVYEECKKIWTSLEPPERLTLQKVSRSEPVTADELRPVQRRGMVRARYGRTPEIFSPVFDRFLQKQSTVRVPSEPGAAAAPPGPGMNFEFTGHPWQVRVGDTLVVNLSPAEYEILRLLHVNRGRACARLELLQAFQGAEFFDRGEKPLGPPLERLTAYIRRLRAKLGPAGVLVRPDGDGYILDA